MEQFWKNLESGEIHFRDKWQFELKTDFYTIPNIKHNTYKQEFYFYIPNALQINSETYSKTQFYKDQTNLIRYKTPEFTLNQLIEPENKRSPLIRLLTLKKNPNVKNQLEWIEDELKLLGNIVRSSLRTTVYEIYVKLNLSDDTDFKKSISKKIHRLTDDIAKLRDKYLEMGQNLLNEWKETSLLKEHIIYVDEFISRSIRFYLIGLLEKFRESPYKDDHESDNKLCEIIVKEENYQKSHFSLILKKAHEPFHSEYILYRAGLLNKFVFDALFLRTVRTSLISRFGHIIGGIAAGVAMLIFFVLFVYQGQIFGINSQPFILATVILYILKDRIKESLKTISYKQALKWFADYSTEILTPDGQQKLGRLDESFTFISAEKASEKIHTMRNREFHAVLEQFKRPEQMIYYKKTLKLNYEKIKGRRHDFNIIFRFNIREFLTKADNPYQSYITIDPKTHRLIHTQLPKVYHLNLILKNTYSNFDLTQKIEYKKFRLIIDKNGIKRVEHLA